MVVSDEKVRGLEERIAKLEARFALIERALRDKFGINLDEVALQALQDSLRPAASQKRS